MKVVAYKNGIEVGCIANPEVILNVNGNFVDLNNILYPIFEKDGEWCIDLTKFFDGSKRSE